MKIFSSTIFFFLTFTSLIASAPDLLLWNEDPKFAVEIAGKTDLFARAFQPHDYKPYIIILSKNLKQPVLMNLTSKEIHALTASDIKKNEEISLYTESIPKGKKIGTYAIEKGVSTFTMEGKKINIRVKESLVDEVPLGVLLAHSPVYASLRDQYKPKKASIEYLKNYKKKVEIVVMFATWCPTCKQMVPRLLRVLQDAKNNNFTMRLCGIAMGGTEPHDLLEKYGHDYPAFIFFEQGKEKGRIIGMTPNPIEETIVSILKK